MTKSLPIVDDAPGLWHQRLNTERQPSAQQRAALFLDRDGVLLEEVNYLHKVEDIQIISGATALVRAANERGIPVIIVTNQSGVGRGYYDWDAFSEIQKRLIASFAAENATFEMVLACAYHAEARPPFNKTDHPWRKPQPGMLHAAAEALQLDLTRSWIVGDSTSDIEAGRNAGLAGAVHVATGHGTRDRTAALKIAAPGFDVRPADSLIGAIGILPT